MGLSSAFLRMKEDSGQDRDRGDGDPGFQRRFSEFGKSVLHPGGVSLCRFLCSFFREGGNDEWEHGLLPPFLCR